MESQFQFYLAMGYNHILDWNAYDHIAYVIALSAAFTMIDWRRAALLVTAFTIGHSLTLALVGLDIIQLSATQKTLIETLIPITIIVTALLNIFSEAKQNKTYNSIYGITAFFGLIHGLGFSTFFRSSLMPGQESDLVEQLFAFNLGVEIGQLLIVGALLGLSYIFINIVKVPRRDWKNIISSIALFVAVYLLS